jgi:hypothetical protein
MLKPLDWLRQAWKSLKQKIFKPVVFFLDNATPDERRLIIDHIKPTLNGMYLENVLSLPKLVVTNISRHGERLDYFLVRCSTIYPHFYSKDCYKNAIVYGESDYVGPLVDTTELANAYSYYDWDRAAATEIFQSFRESLDNKDKIMLGEL